MLAELYIENLAVIERATILFGTGMNVFTGETGAGKSIVIDAINAVLGQRTSREIVRHGTPKASIAARFTELPDPVLRKLADYGYPPEEGELLITRDISADQKSTARLNGRPVNIGTLREIGAELLHIHGQHDNQILLAPERHLGILDRYGDLEPLLEEYHACYRNVVRLKRELRQTSLSEQDKARRQELLSGQLREIQEAQLQPGEEERLEARRTQMKNAQKIVSALRTAHAALYGREGEGGAVELVQSATQELEKAADFWGDAGELYSEMDSISDALEGMTERLSGMIEGVAFRPEELLETEARLDELRQIRRKYGGSLEAALQYAADAESELRTLELSDQRIRELNEQATSEYARLLELAQRVTDARKEAARRFVDAVTGELTFLDMPNVRVEVQMETVKPGPRGRDAVEFLISANVGEPPKAISRIASGGELSRIMLAIQNTLADRDEIPTLIFDEVDAGVSGRAAQKIGQKLKQAAEYRQILTVTHSAQIAAQADCHFLIRKDTDGERTFTTVLPLDEEGRVQEIARIIGTGDPTPLTLENAREMLAQGCRKGAG